MPIMDSLKSLSMGELIERLHNSIRSFAGSIGRVNEMNSQISASDISELRNHIKDRIAKGEDVEHNEKLLKLVDLFSTNKSVMELVKSDADEWVEFLEAIRGSLDHATAGATRAEASEIEEIRKSIERLKLTIRKEEQ